MESSRTSIGQPNLQPTDLRAAVSFATLLAVTALGLGATLRGGWFWLPGQIVLAAVLWSWFSVLHSCGHAAYFKNERLNLLAGHVASLFILIPFYPWKHVDAAHHRWAGWRDRDPELELLPLQMADEQTKRAFAFCWRWWIPVFAFDALANLFWNPTRLRKFLRSDVQFFQCLLSLGVILLGYAALLFAAPALGLAVIGAWFLPWLAFAVLADPFVFSQHALIPMPEAGDESARPFTAREQERMTRTVRVHPWIDRWLLLNFNLHSVHHLYPHLPHYVLHLVRNAPTRDVSFREWIRAAKATDLDALWPVVAPVAAQPLETAAGESPVVPGLTRGKVLKFERRSKRGDSI